MVRLTHTVLLCVVIILVVVAILCHVVALATDFWLKSSNSEVRDFLNLGLFVACFRDYIHKHDVTPTVYDGCHNLHSERYKTIQDWLVPSWLIACRWLAIIALILEVVGLLLIIFLIIWWFCKWVVCSDERDCCERCLIYATPILFIVAGMFIMITVMIFGDNAFKLQCKDFWVGLDDPNSNHLSWSWGFEVAACVFAILSGGFLIWLVVLKARDDI